MNPSHLQSLTEHHQNFKHQMKDLFQSDPERFQKFHLVFGDILVDYSKNLITAETLALLLKFLEEATQFSALRKGLFTGEKINFTEGRPVLHMLSNKFRFVLTLSALRNRANTPILVNGEDVMPEVLKRCYPHCPY